MSAQIELKGLSRYRFEITDNGIAVTHAQLRRTLKGQELAGAAKHGIRIIED